VTHLHVSLTHSAGVAAAAVILGDSVGMDFPPGCRSRRVLRIAKQLEGGYETWCVGGDPRNLLKVENHDST